MKSTKPSVSIGIPAYNEEANIQYLLHALLADRSRHIKLLEIIIVSDGSTDATVKKVKAVKDRRIHIVVQRNRKGIVHSENIIVKRARGSILVMLDADVIPIEPNFLEAITFPIRKNKKVGCVGAATIPLPPRNLFERIIANSHYMKQFLYRQINDGSNVYLCHGRARAFAGKFFRNLTWINNAPEDAFSYFSCIAQKFTFVFTKDAGVFFRSPLNFREHASQSTRFTTGIASLTRIFGSNIVRKEFAIPRVLFIKTLIRYMIRNPFSMPAYLFITALIRLMPKNNNAHTSRFRMASTSKRIILYKGQKLSRI